MSEEFDPYAQWLGIDPRERPINHYQLLGIDLFESDPSRIEVAADQRMVYVRTFQTGPRGRFTQKILNELSLARVCLLDANKKASYDQMLQGLQLADELPPESGLAPVEAAPPPPVAPTAPPAIPPAAPPPVPAAETVVAPTVYVPKRRVTRRRGDSIWVLIILVIGVIAGVAGVYLVAHHLVFPPDPPSPTFGPGGRIHDAAGGADSSP